MLDAEAAECFKLISDFKPLSGGLRKEGLWKQVLNERTDLKQCVEQAEATLLKGPGSVVQGAKARLEKAQTDLFADRSIIAHSGCL